MVNNFPSDDDPPILLIISRLSIPPLLLLLQLLLLFLYPIPIQVMSSFVPADDFAVNCGNQGATKSYDRNWVGDINPKLFSTNEPQTTQSSLTADAPTPRPPPVNAVPYGTARIFRSPFSYSFPLTTSGPKFVRLHFYPAAYHFPNSETYSSLFSVTAANFTLLKDFNASLWLLDGDDETFFVEYCINVEESAGKSKSLLNITFIPSTNHHYAFINGIEVVSMPPFLYYTDTSNNTGGFEQVSSSTTTTPPYQLESKRALQTLYRVDVAGPQIPQAKDTGMFRYWDSDLSRYLEKQYPNSIQTGYGLHLNYKNNTIPNYIAPEDVYLTARTYGMDAKENYNVTWNFQVDSKFMYMVRLHFCEWDERITQLADRRFQIFIDDMMAEETADVIKWSGGRLIPTYRDYAVFMLTQENSSSSKKVNLSIKLQRLREGYGTKISDVLMNGIEVFKISDDDNNLAGPNPDLRQVELLQPPTAQPSRKSSKKTTLVTIVAVVAASSLMLASSVIGIIIILRRKQGMKKGPNEEEEERKKKATEGQSVSSSTLPSHLCRYFTIAEIRAATNNLDDVFIIGAGGFGNVYKGYIDDGSTPVAIKRLKPGSQQGMNEFLNEIEMLSQLRHLHLVSLIGYCNDGGEMILVYDFMQRGTLREYLYGSDHDKPRISWKQRLEILLGAARGLHYLHTGAKHNIIHRDVKTTNILLDDKWVAKVSDFGLSKVGPTGMSTTHVSTIVKGSLGYLDPEYYKRQRLTLKSDVYSFGVVLLEVLCGRPPLLRSVDKKRQSVVEWVRKCHEEGKLDRTVDPSLKDSITPDVLKWYGQMALSCLREDGNQRPSMSDVVGALEFAIQLAESEVEERSVGGGGTPQGVGKSEERPLLAQYPSEEEGSMLFTSTSHESGSNNTTVSASSDDQAMPSALVFSEIGDPKAR